MATLSSYPGTSATLKIQNWASCGDGYLEIDGDVSLLAQVVPQAYARIDGCGYNVTKMFDGDAFDLSAGRQVISNLTVRGNASAGYKGRNFVIGGGNSQKFYSVNSFYTIGPGLEFTAPGAGMQFEWFGGGALCATSTNPAIKLPGNGILGDPSNDLQTQGLRRFEAVDGEGGVLIDFAGGNVTEMENCSGVDAVWHPATRFPKLHGGRFVAGLQVWGVGTLIDESCTLGNGPTLNPGCSQCIIRMGTQNLAWVDNSGNNSNLIYDVGPQTMTPIVSSPAGFSIGNGTLTANVMRRGVEVEVDFQMIAGSTTSIPNAGGWVISLPPPYNFAARHKVTGHVSGTQPNFRTGSIQHAAGQSSWILLPGDNTGTAWGSYVPAIWAPGHDITSHHRFCIG